MECVYIGVDAGATKTILRAEDDKGNIIAIAQGKGASIRVCANQAWQTLSALIENIITTNALSSLPIYIGIGIAGCEMKHDYQAFIKNAPYFTNLIVSSDAYITCLGAHAGNDGSIIAVGTGIVGFQIKDNKTKKISGWGFPHDDKGGGAWIGMKAMSLTCRALDERVLPTRLTNKVYEYFDKDIDKLINFANRAHPCDFATLVPLVIEMSESGDPHAIQILKSAAKEIDHIAEMLHYGEDKICLMGGLSSPLLPYVHDHVRTMLCDPLLKPEQGAILMIKKYSKNRLEK